MNVSHIAKLMGEKENFDGKLSKEKGIHNTSELVHDMVAFNKGVSSSADRSTAYGGLSIGERNQEKIMLLELCDTEHL